MNLSAKIQSDLVNLTLDLNLRDLTSPERCARNLLELGLKFRPLCAEAKKQTDEWYRKILELIRSRDRTALHAWFLKTFLFPSDKT